MIRLGESDCERARAGVLKQPINALTSLAFIPAGVLSIVPAMRVTGRLRRHLAAYAGTVVGVGLGSFAYHGPQPAWAGRAHDGSIVLAVASALLVTATAGRRRKQIWRTGAGRLSAAFIAAALPAYAGGRTGSPLCDPDSSIQLHGVWHVLTAGSALAFAWAAAAAHVGDSSGRRSTPSRPSGHLGARGAIRVGFGGTA
jgi:hypothetical protein